MLGRRVEVDLGVVVGVVGVGVAWWWWGVGVGVGVWGGWVVGRGWGPGRSPVAVAYSGTVK